MYHGFIVPKCKKLSVTDVIAEKLAPCLYSVLVFVVVFAVTRRDNRDKNFVASKVHKIMSPLR